MLRTRHLACLLLLLSSIAAAQAAVPPTRSAGYTPYIVALLHRNAVRAGDHVLDELTSTRPVGPQTFAVPVAAQASLRACWTMRPPSAHAAAVQTRTSFVRFVGV